MPDKKPLKVEPIGLFATPEGQNDLWDRVDKLNGEQKALAAMYVAMTWNLFAKIIAEHNAEGEEDE